ncbi:hypothetical protein EDC01DRAFT_30161 [Geopyxis carbonaria]|nr:hypothetical protein EDC01DRAFT_30161 [Geopyxis carbonaria]
MAFDTDDPFLLILTCLPQSTLFVATLLNEPTKHAAAHGTNTTRGGDGCSAVMWGSSPSITMPVIFHLGFFFFWHPSTGTRDSTPSLHPVASSPSSRWLLSLASHSGHKPSSPSSSSDNSKSMRDEGGRRWTISSPGSPAVRAWIWSNNTCEKKNVAAPEVVVAKIEPHRTNGRRPSAAAFLPVRLLHRLLAREYRPQCQSGASVIADCLDSGIFWRNNSFQR